MSIRSIDQSINNLSSLPMHRPIQSPSERIIPQFEDSLSQESSCCGAFFEAIKNCFIWIFQQLGFCLEQREDLPATNDHILQEIFDQNIRNVFQVSTLHPILIHEYIYSPELENREEIITNQIIHDFSEFNLEPSTDFIQAFQQRMEDMLHITRDDHLPVKLDTSFRILPDNIIQIKISLSTFAHRHLVGDFNHVVLSNSWRIEEARGRLFSVRATSNENINSLVYSSAPPIQPNNRSSTLEWDHGRQLLFNRSDLTPLQEKLNEVALSHEENDGEFLFTPIGRLLELFPEQQSPPELRINFDSSIKRVAASRKISILLTHYRDLNALLQNEQNQLTQRSGLWDVAYRQRPNGIYIDFTKEIY